VTWPTSLCTSPLLAAGFNVGERSDGVCLVLVGIRSRLCLVTPFASTLLSLNMHHNFHPTCPVPLLQMQGAACFRHIPSCFALNPALPAPCVRLSAALPWGAGGSKMVGRVLVVHGHAACCVVL
jgi:hypothetical protein